MHYIHRHIHCLHHQNYKDVLGRGGGREREEKVSGEGGEGGRRGRFWGKQRFFLFGRREGGGRVSGRRGGEFFFFSGGEGGEGRSFREGGGERGRGGFFFVEEEERRGRFSGWGEKVFGKGGRGERGERFPGERGVVVKCAVDRCRQVVSRMSDNKESLNENPGSQKTKRISTKTLLNCDAHEWKQTLCNINHMSHPFTTRMMESEEQ